MFDALLRRQAALQCRFSMPSGDAGATQAQAAVHAQGAVSVITA
ncbi:MAG: hypothetical protein U5K75_09980 [Ahrensia sp.]|nr:hypothetical protein [Ahrensia sp.]